MSIAVSHEDVGPTVGGMVGQKGAGEKSRLYLHVTEDVMKREEETVERLEVQMLRQERMESNAHHVTLNHEEIPVWRSRRKR